MKPRAGILALAFLSALSALAPPAHAAPDGTWAELAPPQRTSHVMAIDAVRNRLVLLGGTSPVGAGPQAWSLGLGGLRDWEHVANAGPAVASLVNASAVPDPARDRLVIVGPGVSSLGTFALATGQWVDRTPPPTLSATGTAIAFDPTRNRLVCFGGQTPCLHRACVHDTLWSVSLTGTSAFVPLAATGPAPAPRTGATAVYDPRRDRVIVFGGSDGGTALSDVWALDLAPTPHWEPLVVAGTPPPGGRFVGYDGELDQAVVLTNYFSAPPLAVWTLSLSGSMAWTQSSAGGTPPAPCYGIAATLDAPRHRLLLNGGALDAGQTWALSLDPGSQWQVIDGPPPGRAYFASAYDAAADRTLVFGGFSLPAYTPLYFNDVWARAYGAPEHWEPLAPTGTPPAPRYDAAVAMDPFARQMIVFGGWLESTRASDTWALGLDPAPAWTPVALTGPRPSARSLATMLYDPGARRMILFGGGNGAQPDTSYADSWALSLEGAPVWAPLATSGTPPAPRHSAKGLYDPRRHRMLVLGGYGAANNADQLWSLSLDGPPTWSPVVAANDPGHLVWEAAYLDSAQDRIVALGPDATATDVWALSLGEPPTWSRLATAGPRPSGRFAESGFFDPARDRLLPFGGVSGGQAGDSPYANDLWALTLSDPGVTDVPRSHASSALGITAAWPNPAVREWSVAFSLPGSAPARLELLDVTGRRVATRDLGSLGAGTHTVRLAGAPTVPAGLYFLRITQGQESAAVRVTVVE